MDARGADQGPDRWRTEGVRWLKRQLDRREWTAADLARALDVGTGTVSKWTSGRPPAPAYAARLADLFGVDVDEVLTLAGRRPKVEEGDPVVRNIAATARLLSPNGRVFLEDYAEFLLRRERAGKETASGTTRPPASSR